MCHTWGFLFYDLYKSKKIIICVNDSHKGQSLVYKSGVKWGYVFFRYKYNQPKLSVLHHPFDLEKSLRQKKSGY